MAIQIAEAFVAVNVKLAELDGQLRQARQMTESTAGAMEKATSGIGFGFMAGIGMGVFNSLKSAIQSVSGQIYGLGKSMVASNAEFEGYEMAFSSLLGSMDAAKQRMKELEEVAINTTFELPQVVRANRVLQTFGGTALATGKNFLMVGDMAAQAQKPFEEVAFWVGRMYSGLKAGIPVGEALMRLTELGLVTGKTRNEIDKLTKSGAGGKKIWEKFTEGFKGEGIQEKMSKTFGGLQSNINDALGKAIRLVGAPLFEEVKGIMQKIYTFLGSKRWDTIVDGLTTSFKGLINTIKGWFGDLTFEQFQDKVEAAFDYVGVIFRNFKNTAKIAFLSLPIAFLDAFPQFEAAFDLIMPVVSGVCEFAKTAFQNFINAILDMFDSLGPKFDAMVKGFMPGIDALTIMVMKAKGATKEEIENEKAHQKLLREDEAMREAESINKLLGRRVGPRPQGDAFGAFFDEQARMSAEIARKGGGKNWLQGFKDDAQKEIDAVEKKHKEDLEAEKAKLKGKDAADKPKPTPDDVWQKAKSKDKNHAEFESAEAMSKKIQLALFKKDDAAEKTAANTAATAAGVDKLNTNIQEALSKPNPAVLS